MKKNIIFILFIVIASIALYIFSINYKEYSLNKSISACAIAQKKFNTNLKPNEIKKKCREAIVKKIDK